jgi:F-type H+-transporting ATPase subunit delta
MQSSAAARRYAKALFAIAREAGSIPAIRAEIDAMASLLESDAALHRALFQPLHPVAERRSVLRGLCDRMSSSATIKNFFAYLIDQRRLVDFDGIRAEYHRLADAEAGRTRAEVVCAAPLRPDQLERLTRALSARTGRRVEVQVRIDESLLGGAVASIEGVVYDGSLRTQLAQLRSTLTRGQHGHQAG